MTSIAEHEQPPRRTTGRRRPPGGLRRLLYPGFLRAAWMTPLFFGIGCGDRRALPLVGRLAPDLVRRDHRARRRADRRADRLPRRHRRLRLLGALRDRRRRPSPEDHSGHGAYSWKDYFRVNTDHKVIGMQYLVDDDLLLPRRRPPRDARARRAREAGNAVLRQPDVQRPLLGPRVADDLPVRHPGVRRAGELRRAADARRARHGVPAPERALVLAAADRRDHDARRASLVPGGAFAAGWTGYAPLSVAPAAWARSSSTWASSGRARARS